MSTYASILAGSSAQILHFLREASIALDMGHLGNRGVIEKMADNGVGCAQLLSLYQNLAETEHSDPFCFF